MIGRKTRQDAVDRKRTIMKKAKELFDLHGIEQVSMHQIAKASDVGQGTLYRHFANKGDLCLSIIHEQTDLFLNQINGWLEASQSESAKQLFHQVLRKWVEFINEKYEWLQAVRQSPPDCGNGKVSFYKMPIYIRMREIFVKLLNRMHQEQSLEGRDAELEADAVLASLNPDLFEYWKKERNYSVLHIADHLFQLYSQSSPLKSIHSAAAMAKPADKRRSGGGGSLMSSKLRDALRE